VQVQLAQAAYCGEGNGHRAHAVSDPLAPMRGANREPNLRPVAQARLGRPHDGQDCDEPAAHHALEHEARIVAAETAQKRHLRRQGQGAFAWPGIEKIGLTRHPPRVDKQWGRVGGTCLGHGEKPSLTERKPEGKWGHPLARSPRATVRPRLA
jgi:hypothetical protein